MMRYAALGLLLLATGARAFLAPQSRLPVAGRRAASATAPVKMSYALAPYEEMRTHAPMPGNFRPYSMGGLAIGGGFGTYDPYAPYAWGGFGPRRQFGDYYDPYADITRGYGMGGFGGLGYGASIEETRGDVWHGRPMFAYDEYNYYDRPWSVQARMDCAY